MPDDNTRDEILSRLQNSITGMTTRRLSRFIGKPSPIVGRHLLDLQTAGHVRRSGTKWKATVAQPPPSKSPQSSVHLQRPRPLPQVPEGRPLKSSNQRQLGSSSPTSPQLKRGRWQTFRKLCEYYAECVRLDQGATIRHKAEEEDLKFVYLPSVVGEPHGTDGWYHFPVQDGWSSFIRKLKSSSYAFLGCPLERFRWQDKKSDAKATYCSPVFLWQVEHQVDGRWLLIRPRGQLRANEGWLQRRIRDPEQRRHFLELCGLLRDTDSDDGTVPSESLLQATDLLQFYYPEWCRDSLDPSRVAVLPSLKSVKKDGIYNRAVLMLPQMNKFTARLHEELLKLANTVTDEELDHSALASLFPTKSDPLQSSVEVNSTLSFASFLPLNTEQRQACVSSQVHTLTVIFGPPGTGKSQAVTAMLTQAAIQNKSALFASRNHQALEAVVPRLNAITDPDQIILRLNHPWGKGADPSLTRGIEEILSRHGDANHREALVADRQRDQVRLNMACESSSQLGSLVDNIYDRRKELNDAMGMLELTLIDVPASFRERVHGKIELPQRTRMEQLLRLLSPRLSWHPRHWVDWLRYHLSKRRLVTEAQAIDAAFCAVYRPGQKPPPGKQTRRLREFLYKALHYWLPFAAAHAAACEVEQLRQVLEGLRDLPSLFDDLGKTTGVIRDTTGEILRSIARHGSSDLSQEDRNKLSECYAALQNRSAADDESDRRRLERYQTKSIKLLQGHIPLLATTNLSVGRDLPLAAGAIDLLILDEASQCDIPSVIPLLFRCRRAVVVGDPKQLPHITSMPAATDRQLRQQFGVADDQLERFSYRSMSAYRLADSSPRVDTRVLLRQHHRCHPAIAEYCNKQFYQGDLVVLTSGDGQGLRWTNVIGPVEGAAGGGSYCKSQIDAVLEELKALETQEFQGTIGVVTPFRNQATRLRDAIWGQFKQRQLDDWRMLVDTADGFQGDERDVILFSLVGGQDMSSGSLGFLSSGPNRFNVAVSRARRLLHVFADREWARTCGISHIQQLLQATEQAEQAAVHQRQAPFREDLVGPVWEPYLAKAMRNADIEFQQQYPSCAGFLDFAIFHEGIKLDVEVDGEAYHRGPDGLRNADDQQRDMALVANGWKIQRFWVYELKENIESCLERIRYQAGIMTK